jgi:hypothetical protein
MPSPTDASPDTNASSLFYDNLLDYLVVALLAVEGIVVGWLGVTALTEVDRSLADEIARDVATNSERPLGLSEQALADTIYSLVVWGSGGLVAVGVVLVVGGLWFYRYRDGVRERVADGRRPPRWHAPLLGGVLATALAFVPFAQVGGGGVAGYLSDRSSTVDGALAGVVFGAPAYVLWGALAVGALAAGTPTLAVFVVFAVLVSVAVDIVLAAISGLLAGLLA